MAMPKVVTKLMTREKGRLVTRRRRKKKTMMKRRMTAT